MEFVARGGSKPHAVMIPFPIQSHIGSFIKLSKVLHSRGFHITYVNTEYNHRRLLNSRGPQALDGLSDFRFETIPDGLPPSDGDTTQHLPSLCESTAQNCLLPFTKLLQKLHESASKGLVPPVTCLISDMAMTFTVKAAQETKIPLAIYSPINAVSYLGLWYGCALHEKGFIPLKDESYLTSGHLDTELNRLSGMNNIRLRDLPSFFSTQDPDDLFMINTARNHLKNAQAAQAMIFNTFSELESDALNTLSSIFPPIYTIGPIHLLLSEIQPNPHLDSIGSNLWKEETTCINWLESKKPKSVVYVNFGSITILSPEQLFEFAWGLANSKKPFLWIIRPDLVNGGSVILSPEFLSETKERGIIASWCEQEKVLNHPSIGGFLTHCGWNSIIEKWGIGIEIDNEVKREEVEKIVNELMEGEKAKEMRNKVLHWKKIAEEAIIAPAGSSNVNLEELIRQILVHKK
ncbi:hypothetical protein K1719_007954 [Acacia pycnantha]|nr:hypothetical protein K1719_007954 [Acacia pycnantha]